MAHLKELALFAGAGGGILGGKLLGWRTVCAVEIDAYCREVLMRRQDEGHLEAFPIWDDVRTFDGTEWRGKVDVVSGGFPCQDISPAGKGAGIDGGRSGLWASMARIIGEVRPQFVFVENSSALVYRGLERVVGDLSRMGFGCRWGVVGADAAGFPHHRARLWLVANSEWNNIRQKSHKRQIGRVGRIEQSMAWDVDWESEIAGLRGKGDGVANNLDRTNAIRNGQVPAVAAAAWRILGGP